MINGKMNTPEEINYWVEKFSVFKESEIEDLPRFDKFGKPEYDQAREERAEEIDRKRTDYWTEATETYMRLGYKSVLSPSGKSLSNFYELENSLLTDILLSKKEFVLIDMPEVMLRMKVGSMFSLDQLKDIFNDILNKIS